MMCTKAHGHDRGEATGEGRDAAARGLRPGRWGLGLAPLYAAAVVTRRWAYDSGLLASHHGGLPTVSVGGLEAGGSGKTPIAAWVLRSLLALGRRPGLLTRGYGREERGLVVRRRGEKVDPARLGDEPSMLVEMGLDVPVAACARRIDGARALADGDTDVLVLDDGFAHRALARDLDLVVLRGEQPLGNGRLLPAGTLREPVTSLRRAHVVWLHFRGPARPEASEWCARHAPDAVCVVSQDGPPRAVDEAGHGHELGGRRLVAAAGTARPEGFFRTLGAAGADVVARRGFRDHHVFREADVAALAQLADREGATAVAVTAKDAVKLRRLWQGAPLWTVIVDTHVLVGEAQVQELLRRCAASHAAQP